MPGTVDSITSAVGGGALDASRVALVIGTTSVMATHVDAKAADLAHGITSIPSPLAERYFVMAENGVGGRALEAWLHQVVFADDALAHAVPVPDDAFARAEAVAAATCAGSRRRAVSAVARRIDRTRTRRRRARRRSSAWVSRRRAPT